MATKKKLFLASSSELAEDRKEFEVFINRKNKDWHDRGVFIELVVWEDFLDAVSATRLQDEYNKAIRECDLFVMLFCTKVGAYTAEEFETAFGQFKATRKPFIFTYFKDAEISTGSADREALKSLWAFQEKLKDLGHFYTVYKSVDALKLHFNGQLDKLVASGFIELDPGRVEPPAAGGTTFEAALTGDGAIAQGPRSTAVGAGGVYVGGQSTGSISTGSRGVSPRELEQLFAPLLAAVSHEAQAADRATALTRVDELKAEVAKGDAADDGRIAKLVDELTAMVPGAIAAVVSTFATPIMTAVSGPVTKFVLDKMRGG